MPPASRASTVWCTSPVRASPRSAGPTTRSGRSSRAARREPRCSPARSRPLTDKPPVLVSGSAIGFYGDRGDEQLTEASEPGTGFAAEVAQAWEEAAAPAAAAGVRVARIRTGIVLAAKGGALERLAGIARFGVLGKIGSGRQWMSWISLADEVGAIRFLLEHDVAGPVNLTAPGPVTNAVFTKTLGRVLNRPTFMPVPSFGPKLLLGSELARVAALRRAARAPRRPGRRRLRVPAHRPGAHPRGAVEVGATSAGSGGRRRRGSTRRSCSCSRAARPPSRRTRPRCRVGPGRARRASASP